VGNVRQLEDERGKPVQQADVQMRVAGKLPREAEQETGDLAAAEDGSAGGEDDARAQVRQVFENLTVALAAAGAGMQHIVKLTVYLTDLADLAVFRSVREEYISLDNPPASSLVQVSGLVNPAFRVEIEALAAL
jgi:enamine deaminase RidA (YjgF/YER057c/UK114 family)